MSRYFGADISVDVCAWTWLCAGAFGSRAAVNPAVQGQTMSRTTELPTTAVRRKSRRKLWLFLFLLVLPAALIALYTWATLHFAYSSGERAGYVQKISKRGWLCKTWEGELAMSTFPGAAPQIFPFSVRNPAVARQVEQGVGRRVALSYEQHKGVPSSCFGETEYFVTAVRPVGP